MSQEQLRAKYTVLQNMWLLAQLRQPGRSIFRDLTRRTFDDHLRLLLNRRNFNFRKEVDGPLLSQPCWSHCLSYEHELRKEAYKLCRLHSIGITAALKAGCHRQRAQDAALGSVDCDRKIPRVQTTRRSPGVKRRLNLKSAVHRSRSLRMRPKQRALPQSKGMLALQAPDTSSSQSKGSARGGPTQNNRKQKAGRGKGGARRVEANVVLES